MEKGRLFVEKKSACRIIAIVCSALSLVTALFTVLGSALLAVFGAFEDEVPSEMRTAIIAMATVSLLLTAHALYELYGTVVSHRTFKHIGWAWVVYPFLALLSKLATTYMNYVETLGVGDGLRRKVDYLGVVSNALTMVVWLAIGIVFLMYESGRLRDKRILLYLSAGVYLFVTVINTIQYINFFLPTGVTLFSVIPMITSIIITLISNFIAYAPPFFLALSMKNTSQSDIGEDHALS